MNFIGNSKNLQIKNHLKNSFGNSRENSFKISRLGYLFKTKPEIKFFEQKNKHEI